MRIETGHICKSCCYYMNEDGDNYAYCCLEPLYTSVKPNHAACESYVSDIDDEDNYTAVKLNKNNIYDEDDDFLNNYEY